MKLARVESDRVGHRLIGPLQKPSIGQPIIRHEQNAHQGFHIAFLQEGDQDRRLWAHPPDRAICPATYTAEIAARPAPSLKACGINRAFGRSCARTSRCRAFAETE